jgi:hypothetical protein
MSKRVTDNFQRSAFGELDVAEMTPTIQLSFANHVSSYLTDTSAWGGGTVTSVSAMANVSTSAVASSMAMMQSRPSIVYHPGQGGRVMFTASFTTGVSGSRQEIGAGDLNDGLFIIMDQDRFGIMRRRGGTEIITYQEDFNVDKLDGTGSSGMQIVPENLNVFKIAFQYLGAGEIDYYVEDPDTGRLFNFHYERFANENTKPSMLDSAFPLCILSKNTTNNTKITVKSASMGGFIEGRGSGVQHALQAKDAAVSVPAGATYTNVITLKNNENFNGSKNKITAEIYGLSLASEGTGNSTTSWAIIKNASFGTTPNYVDTDSNESITSTFVSAVGVSGGRTMAIYEIARDTNEFENTKGINMFAYPGETLTLAAISSAAFQARGSIQWHEEF